ncbi:MAG: bifunctional N-acetylglucosamine-1-phosphate uridyltransferase/glucosamine-1-phosphate acetyltransferase, partial [Acidobacteria bacterium]|nr:bifunctional N-acetylglucosamine-1-phosphate uridyltransferase/glucosamine-1-phosphate acetyltransferase [Acidobacteriota bacterium]
MNAPVSIVILAAGLGTRMKSRKAKVLHRAGGRTLIGHVLSTARRLAPPERIFVVAGHQAEQVRQAVNDPAIGWIIQAEQKGTGHALISGRGQLSPLGGLLLVLYGDCPLAPAGTLEKLVQAQAGSAGAATFTTARLEDPTGYGRVLRDPGGRVVGIVEQRAASAEQLSIREVNLGVYCFGSDLFWKHAGEIRPDNP